MNGNFGVIDPVTTYRLIQSDHDLRRRHTFPGEMRRPTGRHSFAQRLRRVADLIDG